MNRQILQGDCIEQIKTPFAGSGTVGEVAESHGRNSILIELNPKYVTMIKKRTAQQVML